MGTRWTHAVCDSCWFAMNGDRVPSRMIGDDGKDVCCLCLKETDGIYVRGEPESWPCRGMDGVVHQPERS